MRLRAGELFPLSVSALCGELRFFGAKLTHYFICNLSAADLEKGLEFQPRFSREPSPPFPRRKLWQPYLQV